MLLLLQNSAPVVSDAALLQSRFGIMRFGISRFGYYFPNVVAKVGGSDRSREVIEGSIVIEDVLHDAPNECAFEIKHPAVLPQVDDAITMATGNDQRGCRVFEGRVVDVTEVKTRAGERSTFQVECIDGGDWDLGRQRITRSWVDEDVAVICADILEASGSAIGTRFVHTDLGAVAAFSCENDHAREALTRLALEKDAHWYVADDELHFFQAETVQPATALTDAATHFWGLKVAYDMRSLCTRALVEMTQPRKVMIDVPAGSTSVPLEYGGAFFEAGDPFGGNTAHVRFSGSVSHVQEYHLCSGVLGPPAGYASSTKNPGDPSVALSGPQGTWPVPGWAHDAGGHLFYYTVATAPFALLGGIPPSGYGAITATIPAGTPIYALDALTINEGVGVDLKAGDLATFQKRVDDLTAQATYGIREHVLTTEAQAVAAESIGQAYLELHANPVTRIQYQTRDPHAKTGRMVTVSLTEPAITGTFMIQKVTVRFERLEEYTAGSGKGFPIREVEASPMRSADLITYLDRVVS